MAKAQAKNRVSNYSPCACLVHCGFVILSEAKNLSSTEQSYTEILRFAQNDKVNSYAERMV